MSRRRYKIVPGREAAEPGRPLRRPAHGGGGDSHVGEVVVFGAHRSARMAARLGAAQGRRRARSHSGALLSKSQRRDQPCEVVVMRVEQRQTGEKTAT